MMVWRKKTRFSALLANKARTPSRIVTNRSQAGLAIRRLFFGYHVENQLRRSNVSLRAGGGQVLHRCMWLAHKVIDRFAKPMIAPRLAFRIAHPLLDDTPRPGRREEKAMMIQLVSVLHRRR